MKIIKESSNMKQQHLIQTVYIPVLFTFYLRTVLSCTDSEFECANTNCIDKTRRCDSTFDCVDFSDESNCTALEVCVEGQIRCPDGSCANSLDECPFTTAEQEEVTTEQENNKLTNEDSSDTVTNWLPIVVLIAVAVILYMAISIVVTILIKVGKGELIIKILDYVLNKLRSIRIAPNHNKTTESRINMETGLQPQERLAKQISNGNIPPKSTLQQTIR